LSDLIFKYYFFILQYLSYIFEPEEGIMTTYT